MTTEQQGNPFAELIKAEEAALIAEGVKFAEGFLANIFHKHADKIISAATPITLDTHPCPPGETWSDIAGGCVKDIGK